MSTKHIGDSIITCAAPYCGSLFVWHEGTPADRLPAAPKRRGIYCPRCADAWRDLGERARQPTRKGRRKPPSPPLPGMGES